MMCYGADQDRMHRHHCLAFLTFHFLIFNFFRFRPVRKIKKPPPNAGDGLREEKNTN